MRFARALGAGLVLLASACGPILGLDSLYVKPARINDAGQQESAAPILTNAQCMDQAQGLPAISVGGQCVRLEDIDDSGQVVCLKDVRPRADVLRNDNVLLIPVFIPLHGPAPLSQAEVLNYDLAISELNDVGGLPTDPRRDVAIMFCSSEPETATRAVKHIAHDLHVPAIIAAFDAKSMTKFLQDDLVPENVFTLNPSVTDNSVKYLSNLKELAWHLLGTPGDVARAYRPLVERADDFLRNKATTKLTGPLKVALLTADTSTELQMREVLLNGEAVGGKKDPSTALSFNGKNPTDNVANFRDITVNALEHEGESGYRPPDYNGIRSQLESFEPHVIIALTRQEVLQIVRDYETKLKAADKPYPFWFLGPRNDVDILPYFDEDTVGGTFEEKQQRFLGLQYAGAAREDRAERDGWYSRMKQKYPTIDASLWDNTENYYDAVYWIAYGLVAAGRSAPAIGPRISQGVRNLLKGPQIFAGPSDLVSQAFVQLGFGGATFVGALGPPTFDEQFGAWRSVGAVYCYGGSKSEPSIGYDKLRYVPGTSATLKGTLDCTVTNF
jgi:hypothetical protein